MDLLGLNKCKRISQANAPQTDANRSRPGSMELNEQKWPVYSLEQLCITL